MRKVVIAAIGILLLGSMAILVIVMPPGGSRGPATADAPPAAPSSAGPPQPAPAVALVPAMQPDGSIVPIAPDPPTTYGPPPPEPPPGSWEAVPVAARAAALGPVGVAVNGAINDLQPSLSACFDEVSQSQHGQVPFSRTADFKGQEGAGTPILVLELETGAGRVRIVDAPVDTQGSASDGLVACAQRLLRGRVIEGPGVQPGQRARLLLPLIP
jgi:hypothetical protein